MSSRSRRGLARSAAVEAREKEIERLNRSLEGGRPHDVISLEAKNRSNERLISHLNLQVDYLQQTNQELEDRIGELDVGKQTALDENIKLKVDMDKLHQELKDIDLLAQQLEREKQEALNTADREIQEAQIELKQTVISNQDKHDQLLDVEQTNERLALECADVRAEVDDKSRDIKRLNMLLDKLQSDKKVLGEKVKNLQDNEKQLIIELERYRTSPSRARRMDKTPSKLDSFVRTLELERDHYRDECDNLQNLLRESNRMSGRGSPTRSKSPGKSPKKLSNQNAVSLKQLESERDYYKRELKILKAITTPRRKQKTFEPGKSEEYKQVVEERDELQMMLNKFQRHLAEVQSNVKVLSQERDKTNVLYEQANDEVQRLRRECMRSPKHSNKTSLTAQAILRRVESERDSSIGDLRRMTTERDCLRERLKVQQDQSIAERARLEQRSNDLELKINALNEERCDLESRLDAIKELNISQEGEIKIMNNKMKGLEDELQITRCELDDTRAIKNQLEASLGNTQRQLNRKSQELRQSEDRINDLEDRAKEQSAVMTQQRDDVIKLRATVTSLDREKDSLQGKLDDKVEKLLVVEDSLLLKEGEVKDVKGANAALEVKLDHANDDIASNEREIRSLRRQLETTEAELVETNRIKENLSRDNRRMQDDLSTMTRENQDVNLELEETMKSREDLRKALQDKEEQIHNLENSISSKEREITDLLDQYRRMSQDRDDLELKHRLLGDEVAVARQELQGVDGERKKLVVECEHYEREVTKYVQASQTYEQQLSSVTSQLAGAEVECDKLRSEKMRLQEDLATLRELNSKCENQKDHISRQLTDKNVQFQQLHSNYEDISRELDLVHKHLDSERAGNKNLEDMMASCREKEFQAQLNAQEQKSEGQLLRDKLALNDSKLHSVNREVLALRDRNSQLDAELEVTKRSLTNERYEREKAVQELRRHGYPSPAMSRYGRAHSPVNRSASPSRNVSFNLSPTRSPTR